MSLTYPVPSSVRALADRTLEIHRKLPLSEVSGIGLAEQLVSGTCTIEHIARIHRFNLTNHRLVEATTQLMHTAEDNALLRSFDLHGGESGDRWASGIIKKAVSEGYELRDATTPLLALTPDEIYSEFSLGAWRFEYDLTPKKAARFVEEYHRANGVTLDFGKAFGDSAGAVGNALHRRMHQEDPFHAAARAMEVADTDYAFAATMDLDDLTESLSQVTFTTSSATTAAKIVWAPFVAYCVLAVEAPELLSPVNADSAVPPSPTSLAKPYSAYNDAINIFVAYFHPDGKRYVKPGTDSKFFNLSTEIYDFLVKAYYGKKITPAPVWKMLGAMRRWTADNKLAGSLFHVFNADWKKGNWQHILDNIPPDADVRDAFAKFVGDNPLPKAGVKLQQTLTKKADKEEVAAAFAASTQSPDVKPYALSDTQAAKAAEKAGTPLGVFSALEAPKDNLSYVHLGAYQSSDGSIYHALRKSSTGQVVTSTDSFLANALATGVIRVTHGHSDMPGTIYKAATSPEAAPKKADLLMPADLKKYLFNVLSTKQELALEPVNILQTGFALACQDKGHYHVLQDPEHPWSYTSFTSPGYLVGAYRWPKVYNETVVETYIVFRFPDATGKFSVLPDKLRVEEINLEVLIPDYAEKSAPKAPRVPEQATAEFETKDHPNAEWLAKFAPVFAKDVAPGGPPFPVYAVVMSETTSYLACKEAVGWSLSLNDILVNDPAVVYNAVLQGWGENGALVTPPFADPGVKILGAITSDNADDNWIVCQNVKLGYTFAVSDDALSAKLAKMKFKPKGLMKPTAPPLPDGNSPPPTQSGLGGGSSEPDQFVPGLVFDYKGERHVVLAVDGPTVLRQTFTPNMYGTSQVATMSSKELLLQSFKSVGMVPLGPLTLLQHLALQAQWEKLTTDGPSDLLIGEILQIGSSQVVFGGWYTNGTTTLGAVLTPDTSMGTSYWRIMFSEPSVLDVVTPSYAPPVDVPEDPHGADEPDPEQGDVLMAGTPQAFAFAEKKSFSMAVKTDAPEAFHYSLGAKLSYKPDSTRTIIGYAVDAYSGTIYLIETEKGNVNWVTTKNAHKKYGAFLEYVPEVVAALQPLEGAAEKAVPAWKGLNYKLTDFVKDHLRAHPSELGRKPSSGPKAKFHVGTPVYHAAMDKVGVFAYYQTLTSADGTTETYPVVLFGSVPEDASKSLYTVAQLNTQFEVHYSDWTNFNSSLSEFSFGKGDSASTISVSTPTAIFPSEPDMSFLENLVPIPEPAFSEIPKGKHISAGIVVIFPPNSVFSSAAGMAHLQDPAILTYKPLGGYGGYKMVIPKGTVDSGESTLQAAVREVWEETGCAVKPVAFLGDFKGNESITRYFIGYAIGGNLHKKSQPEENAISMIRPLSTDAKGLPAFQNDPWFKQLIPKSGIKTQQRVVMSAWKWLQENGLPHEVPLVAAPYASTPTAVGDTTPDVDDAEFNASLDAALGIDSADPFDEEDITKSGPPTTKAAVFTPTIPADSIGDDVWKALYFKCPFPVTDEMVSKLKSKVASGEAALPTGFDASRDRSNLAFGVAFETEAGTPYTSAGYVSWMSNQGTAHHYLLAWSSGGVIDALPCSATGLETAHVLSDQTSLQQDLDAWFQHPDPETNAIIKTIWQNDDLPKGVTMQTFRLKWCKQAGVPAYSVITKSLLKDVASLFVAGACSEKQKEAIVSSLKARMAQTHKKVKATTKVKASAQSSEAVPVSSVHVAPTLTPAKKVMPPSDFESIMYTQYVTNPQPHLFTSTAQTLAGGSKPNALLNGPGGKQWFAKWSDAEPFRAEFEAVGYQIAQLCKDRNVPVGVMDVEVHGKTRHVSFQPVVANVGYPPVNPAELSPENMGEVLSQHAADMFMGDHDGHVANWLVGKDGRMIAVDRGQAMKFIWQGIEESLDPNWKAPGNIPQIGNEQSYAKHLLKLWQTGKVEIPASAWAQMLGTVERVNSLKAEQLTPIVEAAGYAMGKTDAKVADATGKLVKRASTYKKDWTTVLKKLRKDFEWPSAAPTKALKAAPAFSSSAKALGFTEREEKTIKEAVAAGWMGKSLKIDKDAIEGQDVLMHRVMLQTKPGVQVPATLITFRLARPGAVQAATKLAKNPAFDHSASMGGPSRLKVDLTQGIYESIFAAVKSLNHHIYIEKNPDVNLGTVAKMNAHEPFLKGILDQTGDDPSGLYTPTGEKNEAVYAMAEQYLQYLGIVNYWTDKAADLIGQHSPKLVEFLWEDPPEDPKQEQEVVKPPYSVTFKTQGALWPTVIPSSTVPTVKNMNKPVMNSGNQSQFVIEDPVTQARVFFNPPGGTGIPSLKQGVETLKGQVWAIIPGEPSAATVAHLLALVKDALGIDTSASTALDTEALYWSRQAAAMQSDGAPQPDAHHTIAVEKSYKDALALYTKGNPEQAIPALKQIVADKLGVSLTQLDAMAPPSAIEGEYTRGAGRHRHMRIGWDREKLVKLMGDTCHVAHRLSDSPTVWMNHMRNNGALISGALKPYYGITKEGASPGVDMGSGGGQGLFCCFRKGFSSSKGMIYFDISLALRLDVYIVGTGDNYGNTGQTRYMSPNKWVELKAHVETGVCTPSSHRQVNVRHDIDLQTYLTRVICGSASERDACIKIAKELGWTFANGLAPEKVFVA